MTKLLEDQGHGVFAGCYLESSVEEIRRSHSTLVKPLVVDVTDDASVEAAAATIARELPAGAGLDGLVNNAGILVTPGPVEWTPTSAYRKMMDVNVIGMAAVTKSVLALVRKAQGRIVNVASVAGMVGLPGQPAYCASKYAVEGYSDVLRRDMLNWGVTVHIVEPGIFPQTGLYNTWEGDFKKNWENLPQAVKDDYGGLRARAARTRLCSRGGAAARRELNAAQRRICPRCRCRAARAPCRSAALLVPFTAGL